jgi:hypothetical protein
MTTISSAHTPTGPAPQETGWAISHGARVAFTANAVIAWLGVVLTVVISGLGAYTVQPLEPGLYGIHPDGLAGVVSRLADTASYFTIWSNVVVAVTMTLLVRQPLRSTALLRTLRLDSVLMITITAIVYAVLLAPNTEVVGWSRVTDPILHQVTPAVTVLVWLVYGPRGWITRRTVVAALAIPIVWVAWILLRGSVIGAYPYGFVNIGEYGVGPVAGTLAGILGFGLVVTAVYWGIDSALRRWHTHQPPTAKTS